MMARKGSSTLSGQSGDTAKWRESTGMPGWLQVTRQTHERLDDAFELEGWPVNDVKGTAPIEAR